MGRGGCAWRGPLAAGLLLTALGGAAGSADFPEGVGVIEEGPPLPRFFPREDGDESGPGVIRLRRQRIVGCVPRRVPVPTNAPDDPSYVGSAYGLGKPSVYGFTPPLGVDDPFGRRVLPYCP